MARDTEEKNLCLYILFRLSQFSGFYNITACDFKFITEIQVMEETYLVNSRLYTGLINV